MVKSRKNASGKKRQQNRRKSIRRKFSKKTMKGGYKEEARNGWIQVVFDDEEQNKIKKYLKDNETNGRTVRSTEIRDALFPDISKTAKDNAAHEIQVILGRAWSP